MLAWSVAPLPNAFIGASIRRNPTEVCMESGTEEKAASCSQLCIAMFNVLRQLALRLRLIRAQLHATSNLL